MAFDRDDHPRVRRARAEAAQFDARTRADRAANCLVHGHPAGVVFDTGFGRFCPHCCTFLDPSTAPNAQGAPAAEAEKPEKSPEKAPVEAEKAPEKPKTGPKPRR